MYNMTDIDLYCMLKLHVQVFYNHFTEQLTMTNT